MNDFDDFCRAIGQIALFAVCACCAIAGPVAGVFAVDYFISSEPTINAINAQCGTQYQRLDYLRIGKDAMLQMCETRQKRVELKVQP